MLVLKSTHEALRDSTEKEIQHLNKSLSIAGEHNSSLVRDNAIQRKEIESLQKQNESLQKQIKTLQEAAEKVTDEKNSVSLIIHEDLTKITPIIRYREDVIDKLIELGHISEAQREDKYAIQIALAIISEEALSQMIELFTPDPEEVTE